MKRKKFFLDPKIVLHKKDIMMKRQMTDFCKVFGEFEKYRENYYVDMGENETVIVSYEEEAKFASKFFATCITLEMEDVCMESSWEAMLGFRGSVKISDLVWKHMKKEDKPMVEKLNLCQKFNYQLLSISQEFDLLTIEIKYLADDKKLFVKILPCAGTYIWVKIPPAHFEVPLKLQELKCIYKVVELFINDFERSMDI